MYVKKLTKTKPITFHTSLNILICLLNSFFFLCYMKYLKLDHFHHVGTQHQSSKKKFYTVYVAHNYSIMIFKKAFTHSVQNISWNMLKNYGFYACPHLPDYIMKLFFIFSCMEQAMNRN